LQKQIKLAIVTGRFPEETFIANKVAALLKYNYLITVFCSNVNQQQYRRLFENAHNITIAVLDKKKLALYLVAHPLIFFKHKRKSILLSYLLRDEVNKLKPDIMHFEFSGIAVYYQNIFASLNARKIISCRGTAEKVRLQIDEKLKEKYTYLFNEADAIHCVSEDMRNTILPYCSQSEKIFVNFPSVDTAKFKRTKPYTPQTVATILSVGRLNFQKGYLNGLLAVSELKKKGVIFRWIIVGEGKQREEIIFHIHQMQLQDFVVLAGIKNSDEIIELHQQADIFFLPSFSEGIANVVLEAMSMEMPVVSTRCGGMDEVITHGINGLLADVYDHETLAACMFQLMDNFELRRIMGQAARKRVLEQFTMERQTDVFENVYKGLLSNKF